MFRYFLRIFLTCEQFNDVYLAMGTFFSTQFTILIDGLIGIQEYCLLFSECFYILLLLFVIIYRLCISGPQIECLGRLI